MVGSLTSPCVPAGPASTQSLLPDAFALRRSVFCGEQGVPEEAEFDGLDASAVHLVSVSGGNAIGTCRLLLGDGGVRVGRMAVARTARRRGVGRALLIEAERIARALGAERLTLDAQVAVERFYANAGYVSHGPPFAQSGIEHVAMEKSLA